MPPKLILLENATLARAAKRFPRGPPPTKGLNAKCAGCYHACASKGSGAGRQGLERVYDGVEFNFGVVVMR